MIGHELLQLRVGPRAHVLQQRWRLDDLVAMHDDAGIEVRRLDCGQAGELFLAGLVHRVLSDGQRASQDVKVLSSLARLSFSKVLEILIALQSYWQPS
jgi:hypothetical protein